MNRYMSSAKVLVFVSALGAVSVFADSDMGPEDLEGFFIGVDAAYNHSSVENDETEGVFTHYANGRKEDMKGIGKVKSKRVRTEPSINVGYSHFFGNYYLGLAGDVSFGNGRKSFVITDSGGDEGYETRIGGVSYELKAKGGYYFKELNSVVYGIAGVKWRDVSYRHYGDGQFYSRARLRSPAFLLGLGFERPVYKKLSLSAEYEYSWRNSSGNTFWRDSAMSFDFPVKKQKLREHTLKVGVKCHV